MQKTFLLLATLALGTVTALHAETLTVPETTAGSAGLPVRGSGQGAVLKAFGEPAMRHAPVGGGSAEQPPITRWDYSGFSVFFENSHVVDVVVKDAPAPLRNVDELKATP
jgi:hypothetical protein